MAVDTIFDELGKMTVLELVELKNKIEEEWGITAAASACAGRGRSGTLAGCAIDRPARVPLVRSAAVYLPNFFARPKGGCSS